MEFLRGLFGKNKPRDPYIRGARAQTDMTPQEVEKFKDKYGFDPTGPIDQMPRTGFGPAGADAADDYEEELRKLGKG